MLVGEYAQPLGCVHLKNMLSKLSLGALVYHIWQARNNSCFERGRISKEVTLVTIKSCVKERATLLKNIEMSNENLVVAHN